MNKLPTLLKLTWVSIKGNWAVCAEWEPMIQSAPQVGRGSRVDLNTWRDGWWSVSQALVIEFPGAPEIKVILLGTDVIKSQWQQKERSEKIKAIASAQEQEKQKDVVNYGDIQSNYVFRQTCKMRLHTAGSSLSPWSL